METLLQYSNGGSSGAGLGILIVVYVAVFVLYVAAFWRIFTKAGEAGWKAIIPIYNWYIVLKIVGRPGWWLLLYLIPIVNVIVHIVVLVDLSHSFGMSGWFAAGLLFLGIIFVPVLGFGDARYLGAAAGRGRLSPAPTYQPSPPAGEPPVPPPPPA